MNSCCAAEKRETICSGSGEASLHRRHSQTLGLDHTTCNLSKGLAMWDYPHTWLLAMCQEKYLLHAKFWWKALGIIRLSFGISFSMAFATVLSAFIISLGVDKHFTMPSFCSILAHLKYFYSAMCLPLNQF